MNHSGVSSRRFPAAMVNITNMCTLRCKHCFVYRDGNPNDKSAEMDTTTTLGSFRNYRDATEYKPSYGWGANLS